MSNYSELLKDPRWQKKRLEILQRDNWSCRCCEDKDSTLHVHHMYYINGNSPWEYTNDSLITLCEQCHEEVKNYDWQRAFCDLNITPKQLLELALMHKYFLDKTAKSFSEQGAKYAMNASWHYYHELLGGFENQEDLDNYHCNYRIDHIKKYKKNG